MTTTPFFVTSRSERLAKPWGIQLSSAMLESTRGPSMNPVWAATKRSAPSLTRVRTTSHAPTCQVPTVHEEKTCSRRTAFIVLPSAGAACHRR